MRRLHNKVFLSVIIFCALLLILSLFLENDLISGRATADEINLTIEENNQTYENVIDSNQSNTTQENNESVESPPGTETNQTNDSIESPPTFNELFEEELDIVKIRNPQEMWFALKDYFGW